VEGEPQGDGANRRRGRGRDRNRPRREDGQGDVSGETATDGLEGNGALTAAPGAAVTDDAPTPPAGRAVPTAAGPTGDAPSHADVLAPSADETLARVAKPFESRAFSPEPVAAPAPAPATTPTPAPAAAVTYAPVVEKFDLPIADLNALAGAAGLEWVHSDADRVRTAQEAIANAPQPVRVPRERPPAVVVDEGPLVLVETRKDLSQVKLPFDTNPPQPSATE
jgi:ribonuclease E